MKLASRIFRREDWYVTSKFGMRISPITGAMSMHNGTDYGTNNQKWPQYAIENGTVISAGKDSSGANFARINFPHSGIELLYYHLDAVFVKTGQIVTADTIIGNTGATGNTTGIHLHLAMWRIGSSVPLDPHAFDWQPAAGNPAAPSPAAPTSGTKSAEQIAREIWNEVGNWGNGDERKNKLTAAGYDPKLVQAWIDHLYFGDVKPPQNPGGSPSAPASTIKEGSIVRVKSGARDYKGGGIAAFVFKNTYRVDELRGDRAVLDLKGICTPVNVKDLEVV